MNRYSEVFVVAGRSLALSIPTFDSARRPQEIVRVLHFRDLTTYYVKINVVHLNCVV